MTVLVWRFLYRYRASPQTSTHQDHENAQIIAESIRTCDGLTLRPETVDTNIVIFEVDPALGPATQFASVLQQHGVWMMGVGGAMVRAVTHLDVSRADAVAAASIIRRVAEGLAQDTIQLP